MRDGTADFTTIQPAIDVASPGDTISIGPGRYDEMTRFSPVPGKQGWPKLTCIGVRIDSLTFVGDDTATVIVGPEAPNYTIDGPMGLVNMANGTFLFVRGMTFENVYGGIEVNGDVVIAECAVQSCGVGVWHWYEARLEVRDCQIIGNDNGVIAIDGREVSVGNCSFLANDETGIDVSGSTGVEVLDAMFAGNGVSIQFEQGSSGTIAHNTIHDSRVCGIIVTLSSQVAILGNQVAGGPCAVLVDPGCVISGSSNALGPCSSRTLFFWGATSVFQGNHILNGGGYSVYCEGFGSPPVRTIDLTNNYWGTTSADSIAAWIRDGNDDPALYVTVDFEPFSPVPVPEKKESFGGVKALFRGRR